MYKERKKLYAELAKARQSKVLVYVTGDRRGLETQISSETLELFGNLLDSYGNTKRISLFLYTRGGETLAAWGIVNLLREFCDELEVIVPSRCHSAGTLICLGADRVVMTKQATLGPIDPSTNSPLNPQIPGAAPQSRLPISVEDVAGFIEMAKAQGISSEQYLSTIFAKLADHVHPVALGRVGRTRGQIKDLARKLLDRHYKDKKQIANIINMLCSEAGSHDYLIYRTEARNLLKLDVETPTKSLYSIIKAVYSDVKEELKLEQTYNPANNVAMNKSQKYDLVRALVESQRWGGYQFARTGTLAKSQDPNGLTIVKDEVEFEGWKFSK